MVIFLACIFVVLANVASSFIHLFFSKSSFDGGGMLIWVWLFNSCIIGCVCQFFTLFVMYIIFLIRKVIYDTKNSTIFSWIHLQAYLA